MNSNSKNQNIINYIGVESIEDSNFINQNNKNLSNSTNKSNINMKFNSSSSNNSSNNSNHINNNNQININKKNKKKRDKKKDNQQNNSNFNNNIKHLNNNYNNNNNHSSNKQKEPSNQQKLEEANYQMQQMNYIIAEKQYKLIYENCSNYSNQFLINLLNNYAICLYHQRKYEKATQIASKIILDYDNKNKRAYLTILSILCNIKEYKKAQELIDKINTIFKKPKDFELFKGIINDINNALNEEEDNKQRNIYYNREKKIIDLVHNKWAHLGMYSIGTFIGACLLYKFISK